MRFLGSRHDRATKILDLSHLAGDPILQRMNLFADPDIMRKIFPVLMKLVDESFPKASLKEDMILDVSLKDNQIPNVLAVATLAVTLPHLRGLDLSGNKINDYDGLQPWRFRLRQLEKLYLAGNGVNALTDVKDTMTAWYPRLRVLSGVEVRTAEEVAHSQTALESLPAFFQDETNIAAQFLTTFFPLFDTDRIAALRSFYDEHSTFSLSVNAHKPRSAGDLGSNTWEPHIKSSRNLLKVTHLHTRHTRRYCGAPIQECWTRFPATRHPPLDRQPKDWLIECHPLQGLADWTGHTPGGLGGLIITVHGQFEESDVPGKPVVTRSFDRTFVLGPGAEPGQVRVTSDILLLREFHAFDAWCTSYDRDPPRKHPEIHPSSGIGEPAANKSEELLQQERAIIQFSLDTGLKAQLSHDCLMNNGWNFDVAAEDFKRLVLGNLLQEDMFNNLDAVKKIKGLA